MAARFGLLFVDHSGVPGPPISQVYLRSSIQHDYPGVPKGMTYVTLGALSLQGLEGQIDVLQQELETIRQEARRKYALSLERRKASGAVAASAPPVLAGAPAPAR